MSPVANPLIEQNVSKRSHSCVIELITKIAYTGSERKYMSWSALLCSCRSYLGLCLFQGTLQKFKIVISNIGLGLSQISIVTIGAWRALFADESRQRFPAPASR